MKTEKPFYFLIFCCLILFYCCSSETNKNDDSEIDVPEQSEQEKAVSTDAGKVLKDWNAYLNKHDVDGLSKLFAPTVEYYGRPYSREQMIQEKMKALASAPEFEQTISNIEKLDLPGDDIEFSFVKSHRVKKDADFTKTEGLIALRKVNDKWFIIKESDAESERKSAASAPRENIPRKRIQGDFNGDGQQEWLVEVLTDVNGKLITDTRAMDMEPLIEKWGQTTKDGKFKCSLQDESGNLPALTDVEGFGTVHLFNEGDLTGNGADEISFMNAYLDWSGMNSLEVYTLKAGKWKHLGSASVREQFDREDLEAAVQKGKKPGVILLRNFDKEVMEGTSEQVFDEVKVD